MNARFWCSLILITGCGATGCNLPQRTVRFSDAFKDNQSKVQSFSTPADLRLGFVRKLKDDTVVYCGEPMPDVALNSEVSGSGSLSVALGAAQAAALSSATSRIDALSRENERLRQDLRSQDKTATASNESRTQSSGASAQAQYSGSLDAAATAKVAITVAQLAGRTQQVLLAREYFYRLCEAAANGFVKPDGTTIYVDLLKRGLEMIEKIEQAEAQATQKGDTAADRNKKELADIEEKMRNALLAACSGGDGCAALAKEAVFDAEYKVLKLRKADFKYTQSTNPLGHQYEPTDSTKKARLNLPASDWTVGTIVETIWVKKNVL